MLESFCSRFAGKKVLHGWLYYPYLHEDSDGLTGGFRYHFVI